MNFVSYAFLFLFLIVFAARLTIGKTKTEVPFLVILLVSSLIFYAYHIPQYLVILILSTVIDYVASLKIIRCEPGTLKRKLYLVVSLSANLGLLGFFKYSNFALNNIKAFFSVLGLSGALIPHLDIILPMGISFYTFQSMSYTIDVYRGVVIPIRSFWRFLLYISFFPQLVAGPIVRAKDFLYQINRKRRVRLLFLAEGAYLMIQGYFLKMVIADNLAHYVNEYWAWGSDPARTAAVPIILVFLFSIQIFADFAGYSSIAIGLALMLGFRIPINFNNPYIAGSFREFWTRWHISLSQWLRDYLYVPLGGNRISRIRTYVNLMAVMLLGGLWHGAGYSFIVWGGIHGGALAVEKLLGFHKDNHPWWSRLIWYIVVQVVVLVTWIFFRAFGLHNGLDFLMNILRGGFSLENSHEIVPALLFTLPVIAMHIRALLADRKILSRPSSLEKGLLAGLMLYCILTWYGTISDFIYFQF